MDAEQEASAGASALARLRWANATDEEKSKHGKKMAKARQKKLSKKKRVEIAKQGGLKRAEMYRTGELKKKDK